MCPWRAAGRPGLVSAGRRRDMPRRRARISLFYRGDKSGKLAYGWRRHNTGNGMKPGRGEGVCVIIPAFNAETTIARAIKSALAQVHVQEVVVCDDGSKDDTAKVAALQDDGTGRLSVVKLNENKGPAAARNIGIGASRAPCVCLLDSDDFF